MLKLAVEAQLPLVAVTTRDTMNLNEILLEITKKTAIPWTPVTATAKGQLYMHVHDEKMKLPLTKLYEQMVKQGSTLILVNMPGVVEPMFDAGEVPVPRKLMMRFMKAVVDSDKAAEELLRGLGGCTIKEAAELARLTMARDKSLTVQGLMTTRKSSFQASKGLTQVDSSQGFYAPPAELVQWVSAEKSVLPDRHRPPADAARPVDGRTPRGRKNRRLEVDRRAARACRSTASTSAAPRTSMSASPRATC